MENPDVGKVKSMRVTIVAKHGNEGSANGIRSSRTVSGVDGTSEGWRLDGCEVGNIRQDEIGSLGINKCKSSEGEGSSINVSYSRRGDKMRGVHHEGSEWKGRDKVINISEIKDCRVRRSRKAGTGRSASRVSEVARARGGAKHRGSRRQ